MEPILTTEKSQLLIGSMKDVFPNFLFDFEKATQHLNLVERPSIVVFGKEGRQNRDVGFFSNTSVGYQYSNQIMRSQPLTPELEQLMVQINEKFIHNSQNNKFKEENTLKPFNGILVNRYRDGRNGIGKHSDDEKSLSSSGVVAISLGATRNFRIRAKEIGKEFQIHPNSFIPSTNSNVVYGKTTKKDEIVFNLPMCDQMIVWMYGNFQNEFTHEVPVEKKVKEERISLTFRSHNK